MHITITGNLGSGKSTVCNVLQENYKFHVYSMGKIQRELAAERNMTTLEFNQLMCSDHKYDTIIDDTTMKIASENKDKDLIFDSRLAWNFVKESFKVFISVSLNTSAIRVMNDQKRGEVEKYSSLEEAKKLLKERAETEKRRYKDIYNLDYFDFKNYNLIVDSTYATPDEIANIIIEGSKEYEKTGEPYSKHLVSPKRIINENDISDKDKEALKELADQHRNESIFTGGIIKVERSDDEFTVIDDIDKVKIAYLAGVNFIQIME